MIIENPDAFKSWLTSILEPLCDADPAALAKYVYALVKKDRVLEDLREGMLDQLDVFLQHETKPFVDMLFKALETQEYLKLMAVKEEREPSPSPALEPEPQEPSNEIEEVEPAAPAANGTTSEEARPIGNAVSKSPPASGAPRHRVVMSRHAGVKHAAPAPRPPPHAEQTLVKLMPLTELLEEPIDQPPRRRDRRNDAMRDKDDRRRRRSRSWERRVRARRHASPHNDGRRFDNRRLTSRSPSPRGRYRNRSPPPVAGERPLSRSRSRSPIPLRERPHDRERERIRPPRELERERMSRDREHRERVSRSRDRDRSRDRSRERSRGSAGTPTQEMCDRAAAYKRRCRDFDEKGYCMRGDLCQWDHGTDPLVLEDAALSRVLHMPPPVPEYNPLSPDIWGGAAMGPGLAPFPPHHMPPARELIPIPRIHDVPPPPLIPPPAPHPPRAHAPMQKRIFDYNRLGGPRSAMGPGGVGNCSLEVKKVPRGMNDITHLNQHFGKFGKIVNIQVCYEGDPEAALITFSNHTEANVAYKSTEAVLNNRFIKVFWHIHESKQENVPPQPSAAAPGNKLGTASHNKVLINKDNMRVTQDNLARKATEEKQAKEAAAQNGEAIKKEIAPAPKPLEKTKQMMEHKRAQTLLETQLQQQVLLINKLESGNVTGPQKAALMDAINSSQEGIEKLRKELVAYNKTLRQVQEESVARSLGRLQLSQANAKRPKTREEAQKEILDAELDLFTKQQEGQDITELAKKISELRRQMSLQFPTHARPQRPHSRGARFNPSVHRINRTASAQHANPHQVPHQPKVFVNQSLDHRPRAVLISGFETDELQPLIAHFSQFGEVTGKEVNMAVPELTLQFKVRSMAEQAMARGKNYNERTLSITWVTNNKPITPLASTAAVAQPEPPLPTNGQTHETIAEDVAEQLKQELTEDVLLRFDEEEEDDAEEDRSWRR